MQITQVHTDVLLALNLQLPFGCCRLMPACWPVLRDAIRGYSQAEADKLPVPERRRRTSRRVANGARFVYLLIQIVCIVILFESDSALGSSWRAAYATYAWSFLSLTTANLLLYAFLCVSDPGFLPIHETDTENKPLVGDPSQDSSSDIPDPGNPPVHKQQAGAASYQPLPYPTNYANYINPALSRSSHDTAAVTTPWWDLPNPGTFQCINQQFASPMLQEDLTGLGRPARPVGLLKAYPPA